MKFYGKLDNGLPKPVPGDRKKFLEVNPAEDGYQLGSSLAEAVTKTGNFTLQDVDHNRIIKVNANADSTANLPTNLDNGFTATIINVMPDKTLSLSAASLNTSGGVSVLGTQNSACTVTFVDNAWYAFGELS